MRIQNFLCLSVLFSAAFNLTAHADPDRQAAIELGKEVQALQDKQKQKGLSSEEIAKESNQIFNNFEQRVEGQEDKVVISVAKNVAAQFAGKLVDYSNFLNKVAEPTFFDMKVVQDTKILDQQIITAKEYLQRSKTMAEESKNQPALIRKALEEKNIDSKSIQQFLNGMAQSEAGSEKTPVKIMTARTKHAELILKALEQLKTWKGKWTFNDAKGVIVFNSKDDLKLWTDDIITPLIAVEEKLA